MTDARPNPPDTVRWIELVVLLVVVLTRVQAEASIAASPYGAAPLVDAYTYFEQARALLAGDNPFEDAYYQPPGYPWLLSWLFAAFGDEADLALGRHLNLALGVATTGLVIQVARSLALRLARPAWLGAVAGLIYALYPSTLLFELDLLTPAVTSFLLSAALALLVLGEAVGPLRAGLAGLALGAAVVVHPTYLLAGLGLGGGLAVWRRHVPTVAAFAVGLGVAVAPTAYVNTVAHEAPALVSHNAGLNFYLGNNADWKRTAFLRAGVPFRQLVVEAEPHRRSQAERNDYWVDRTWAEIGEAPGAWIGALATKAVWSINNREVPRNEDYRCRTDDGPLAWIGRLPVRYGLVLPFALAGLVVLWRLPRGRLLVAAGLGLHASLVVFLVADRYRLATWPVLSVAGALGAPVVFEMLRGLTSGLRPHPAWLGVIGLTVVSWWPIDHVTAYQRGWCVHQDGNFALNAGDFQAAEALYLEAARLEPEGLGHWYWLGETRLRLDQPEAAAEALERVIAEYPDHYQSRMALQKAYGAMGDFSAAADHAEAACAVPGPRTNTCARYVELLVKSLQLDKARAVLADKPELREHSKVRKYAQQLGI